MFDYFNIVQSVYENDTFLFLNLVEKEYQIAINQTSTNKRNSLLRALRTQLLLVYGKKVEGVCKTPSRIVDLLDLIENHFNNEQ
jgi:hypothetical protein